MTLQHTIARLATTVIWIALLGGCTAGPLRPTPTPTPNVQATVDAAVLATATAQAETDAVVATAVAATQTATAPAEVEPTPGAGGQPTPAPDEASTEIYVTMSEEELAALIDDAVSEAVAETEAAAATTATATADETLTPEEVESIEVVIEGADEAIALAEELLVAYADLYGELATETLAMVEELEALLAATTEAVIVMTDILVDIDVALEQGIALTAEVIQQLEDAAQLAGTRATVLQEQIATWSQTVEAEIDRRVGDALAVPPNDVAESRLEAINAGYQYIETAREALSDRRLSQGELSTIAQVGANAGAGLKAQGGPQLQEIAETLDEITATIARGSLPEVQGRLQSLEASLPARPGRP